VVANGRADPVEHQDPLGPPRRADPVSHHDERALALGERLFGTLFGHRIQVTGRTSSDSTMDRSSAATSAPATSTTPSTATTTDTKGPQLEVQSIKMISTSCS